MTNLNRIFSLVPGLVASIALLAVAMNMPALAQDTHIQRYGEKDAEKTPAEKSAEKEAQKAYERSLGNIPAQQSTDPWGIARGDSAAPKAATKTASPKPKAKTDSKTDSAAKQ